MAYNHLFSEILLAQGDADKAIGAHEKIGGASLNIGNIGSLIYHGIPYTRDLPARAYLKKGQLDKAIAEYEKLVAPDPVGREYELIHPMSRLHLAELYEKKGEPAKALQQYSELATIWKGADAGFAAAQKVKERLAALKAG